MIRDCECGDCHGATMRAVAEFCVMAAFFALVLAYFIAFGG